MIIFVLFAASLVDYPLRTPLMEVMFVIACGWLAQRPPPVPATGKRGGDGGWVNRLYHPAPFGYRHRRSANFPRVERVLMRSPGCFSASPPSLLRAARGRASSAVPDLTVVPGTVAAARPGRLRHHRQRPPRPDRPLDEIAIDVFGVPEMTRAHAGRRERADRLPPDRTGRGLGQDPRSTRRGDRRTGCAAGFLRNPPRSRSI